MINKLQNKLNKQLKGYIIDLGNKEIRKGTIKTHTFWVEFRKNILVITWIKDETIVKKFWVYYITWSRSHKWIGTQAIKICVNFCIENWMGFSFSPSDEWWDFWKKLSPIVQQKQKESDKEIVLKTITLKGKELKKFQRDVFWFLLKTKLKKFLSFFK